MAMVRRWIAELPAKTGKALDEWVELVQALGPDDLPGRRKWLKERHGFASGAAWWLADYSVGESLWDYDEAAYLAKAPEFVDEQFAGPKAALRPVYDRLLEIALGLGPQVRICPCKTMVPIYRRYVIAQMKATTRTRLDLGFALKGMPFTKRLLDTGGTAKKDRITHRVALALPTDIDDQVVGWLRAAYAADAPP